MTKKPSEKKAPSLKATPMNERKKPAKSDYEPPKLTKFEKLEKLIVSGE
jgi:hypothetical protein